jgi:hypothetical protein
VVLARLDGEGERIFAEKTDRIWEDLAQDLT